MLALALGAALAFSAVLMHQRPAQGTDGSGDFIIRCFYNGNIATDDPIAKPGSSNTDHLHAFFGNMASGGTALNGTTQVAFPTMKAGDDGAAGTMEQNGLNPATNCQDSKDTAGYWIPEPYLVPPPPGTPVPYLPGPGGSGGCSTSCSTSTLYMRVYYIPHGDNTTNQEIPDGTIMINGYPAGCANVDGVEPDGCTVGGPSYPKDLRVVEYSCGASQGGGFATPHSAWPYNCNNYTDGDDSFSDGLVAFVNFPYCWNKQADFPAPNAPVNAQGLPSKMVPGYVAPWIPYTAWQNYPGLTQRPSNDFYYPTGGGCHQGDTTVVQLEQRIHLLTFGKGWGEPSTCTGDGGIGSNTGANSENSTTSDDSGEAGGADNDPKLVQVSPGLWGPHKCVAGSAPSPNGTTSTLSFACSHADDPNCTGNIGIPGPTTGCSAPGTNCFVGAYPNGWETLHADYWQTWKEAKNPLDSQPGNSDVPSDAGTFGDLVEDCVQGTGTANCSPTFITNTSPPQVYGSASNP
jgi:Domain of unknown function (DUF1996)